MSHVVLIRHNSYLFKGTVEENLRMAKQDATEEEMKEVLEKVNLLGFLETQDGIKTKLLEKAGNLSGGQCQRLAIARALLMDAPVYIFDEATSNIDVESEELIMNVIHEIAKTKTVLLISHRLANVVNSDQIYFLKDGEIRESGKHGELMKHNGAYRHLYESQMALEKLWKGENRIMKKKRRSAVSIMGSLIGLVKPLLHIMTAAIILGTAGYLCAIFLTISAGQTIVHGLMTGRGVAGAEISMKMRIVAYISLHKNTYFYYDHNCSSPWNFALCGTVLQPFYRF